MNRNIKTIAAFDFDGTLTLCDTLPLFIIHSKGWCNFLIGILFLSPILFAYTFRIISNDKAKQMLFSHYFKGMEYHTFCKYGHSFIKKIESIKNQTVFELLQSHMNSGHNIYIISASIYEWIYPWAKENNINNVLTTRVEIDQKGKLTGKFLTNNCYGKEKISRLISVEPIRKSYYLYAYGNSNGDIPLLNFADTGRLFRTNTIQIINGIIKYIKKSV